MGTYKDSRPLVNDPAREAVPSMRGYWAQVWRSVLVWMDLGDTERLYLEGAEDIDRISGLTAETIQVKDVSGNVTLRSKDVIEAIGNAWAHQQRNPRHRVKFRFLATAGISVEQGAPFGTGIGGLRLWQHSRLSEEVAGRERDSRAIAYFLLAEGKVSTAVQTFLRAASAAQIWQRLIAPIEWDTEAEEAPEVIREIKDRLVVLGQKSGVTPDKADEVAEHLYAAAYAAATRQKDRYLTHAELLRLFHERTHVSLPAATANLLLAAIPQHMGPTGSLPVAIGGRSVAIGRPPPLPARYYSREALLADIATRLSSYPVLILQGATGVGKSIAAVGQVVASSSFWGWVDLRGVPSSTLAEVLERVIAELVAEEGLTRVVLDDIEFPIDSRYIETPLARIKNILCGRDGKLMITSSVSLPQRLSLVLAVPASGTIPIPPFSREEIAQFLISRGCPATEVAHSWAAFVELHTSGHAQLVHARIAAIEAQDFPIPDLQTITETPSDVLEARAEARRLITILDAPTRELIYRLSLTAHALPKRQVLAIASQSPAIAEAGLVFDRLVGPWLEVVSEGLFRVSPLLRGLGPEVQGEAWGTAMHAGIARAILGFRTLSPMDVSTVLFHATAAREWTLVARLSLGLLKSDKETWEALAQSANWFVAVGTHGAMRPEADVFSLSLVRLLQLRLAAADHNDAGAASVLACINEELPPTVEGTPLRLSRYFLLGQVQLCTEVALPIEQLMSIGFESIRLADELKDVLADIHYTESIQGLAGPDGKSDPAGVAGLTLIPHLTDRHHLAALLDACEPEDIDVVRRLMWSVGGQEFTAQLIFDRVWLSEFQTATPDWLECREVFQRAYAFARRYALPGLAQGAARAIAHLTDESLNDRAEALRLADEMAAEIGPSPGQDDERASIMLRKGDTAGALAIWRELLPRWPAGSQFDLQQTFSHRLAAVAAARLGEWIEAADWLRRAAVLAVDVSQATYRAGLLVDQGFARWKGGDNRGAFECLVEGVTAIDRLPADDADESAYLLRKRAGHTAMWIANSVAGTPPKEFSEPPPALCSSPEPTTEVRPPSTPSDATWLNILEFEFAAKLGDQQFRSHEERLKASRYGLIRLSFDGLRIRSRLRSLALDDFVEIVADWTDAFALCRRFYKESGLGAADPLPPDATPPDRQQVDADLVLGGMLSAVFELAARGMVTKQLLDHWTASAARAGLSAVTAPWLEFLAALFVHNENNGKAALRDTSLPWPWQALASIRIAIDSDTEPAELLMIHEYWTTNLLPNMPMGSFVLAEIEALVTSAWRRLSEKKFLLRSPLQTVPLLQEACASASTGWQKIGEVLTAACDVVPASVPNEFRKRFQKLKQGGA